MDLAAQHCVPCEGGAFPLTEAEAKERMRLLSDWTLAPGAARIEKRFAFPDFKSAMSFALRIAEIAESEGHHPDLSVSWGALGVSLATHAIGGLSENDFILAAKIDALLSDQG